MSELLRLEGVTKSFGKVRVLSGTGFLLAGTVMMLLMNRHDTNVLNFTMATCIVKDTVARSPARTRTARRALPNPLSSAEIS